MKACVQYMCVWVYLSVCVCVSTVSWEILNLEEKTKSIKKQAHLSSVGTGQGHHSSSTDRNSDFLLQSNTEYLFQLFIIAF